MNVSGVKSHTSRERIGVQLIANFSGMYFATFFGMISPMIMIRRVMTIEDTVTPFPPRRFVKNTVARDADTTLTICSRSLTARKRKTCEKNGGYPLVVPAK